MFEFFVDFLCRKTIPCRIMRQDKWFLHSLLHQDKVYFQIAGDVEAVLRAALLTHEMKQNAMPGFMCEYEQPFFKVQTGVKAAIHINGSPVRLRRGTAVRDRDHFQVHQNRSDERLAGQEF